ncbi:MAG: 4Fe-4S dicluster domain-containing protein [Clostridia bacterium]|nr:4Fe-4S dicluster domain-containing protein [Clostridia bacterium]
MPSIPHRELYWEIPGHLWLYAFMVIAGIILLWGLYQHYLRWTIGKPEPEKRYDQLWERIKTVIVNSFGHSKMLRDPYPGIMHFLIFWGFAFLFLAAFLDVLEAWFGLPIMFGQFYIGMSWLTDLMGLAGILGILVAIIRRYIQKPDRLDNIADDAVLLVWLLFILVLGFCLEGMRIAANPDPWPYANPVGTWVSALFASMNDQSLLSLYRYTWWVHGLTAMALVAYIPWSKAFHIFMGPANQFMRSLAPAGVISPIDFEDEDQEVFGAEKIEDLTWKQLFDTEACTRCGRCQDNCPAYLSEKPLSPKKMTQDLKAHFLEKAPILLAQKQKDKSKGDDKEAEAGGREVAAVDEKAAAILEKSLIGDVVTEDEIWACTTCRACQEQCPVFVEHVNKTVELRRYLVLTESRFPSEMQLAFRNMENNGNPWGVGWANRADWTEGLEVRNMANVEGGQVDVLFWPGCAGAFDDRNRKVAKAMVNIMNQAGVDFAILGTEEKCCGDSARRLGNEYLFQSLVEENISTLKQYKFNRIVTQCPHCFNVLKKEYPQFGGEFTVIHHSEFLLELLQQGRIRPSKSQDLTFTYHDSCYLGRYNEIYHQPRSILARVPGVKLVEMERNHGKSFCCGAGGGRMWLEEKLGKSINVMRTEQALATGAQAIATACPFCLTMLSDGLKSKDKEDIAALDLAEILERSLAS